MCLYCVTSNLQSLPAKCFVVRVLWEIKKTGGDRALGKVGKGQCLLPAGPRVENERLREVEIQKYLESCQYAFEKVKHDSCTNTPVSKT